MAGKPIGAMPSRLIAIGSATFDGAERRQGTAVATRSLGRNRICLSVCHVCGQSSPLEARDEGTNEPMWLREAAAAFRKALTLPSRQRGVAFACAYSLEQSES